MASGAPPLRGRQAQAAQNDGLILQAAREVFLADPTAPISAVAERAGVGIGALYHRYAGKEDLLRTLCRNGQEIYLTEIKRAFPDSFDVAPPFVLNGWREGDRSWFNGEPVKAITRVIHLYSSNWMELFLADRRLA